MIKFRSQYEGPWASAKPALFAYPTAEWRSRRPETRAAKCRHCGLCYLQCPTASIRDMGTYFKADLSYCKGCGVCARECPNHAIIMIREEVA